MNKYFRLFEIIFVSIFYVWCGYDTIVDITKLTDPAIRKTFIDMLFFIMASGFFYNLSKINNNAPVA